MEKGKEVISVASKHIESGIKKYNGIQDIQLNSLIRNAGFDYTAYVFEDKRILLVLPGNTSAFLYADENILFQMLDLAK